MTTYCLRVTGRVQGVGFRPAVCRIAHQLGLSGEVCNAGGEAEILCNADASQLGQFLEALRQCPPPIRIDHITAGESVPRRFSAFTAAESYHKSEVSFLPADIGICPACLKELWERGNARRRYPFISCAQCGPRYTIIRSLPYDRERTAMDVFPMCSLCKKQYADVQDRRCHGETLSCHSCGPQLLGTVRGSGRRFEKEEALQQARALLQEGKIIAVKAVGGYNLVCRADSTAAVTALRTLKNRPTKPFAVLAASFSEAASICRISSQERALLESAARPIVLLRRAPGWEKAVCRETADPSGSLGIFLPAVGLYALLAEKLPLIVTSCNRSGEPILYRDSDLSAYYQEHTKIAGVFYNQRQILRPADDAVTRIIGGSPQLLRRTRGYMPEPVVTDAPLGEVLALGAQMEPAMCFAGSGRLCPVAVPGDLSELSSQQLFRDTVKDLSGLLQIRPQKVVCDLHPLYFTTALAKTYGLPVLQVQHHHAHALSVMVENHLSGEVLAVCFDGTGYGTNGAVWGGEFLLCKGLECTRVGHLAEIPMLGGDGSMRQGWKSAICHLAHAGLTSGDSRFPVVCAALRANINVIHNSSMGRLFDAAAAVLGLCQENTHQGRCAMTCENAAAAAAARGETPVPMDFAEQNGIFDPAPLFPVLLAEKENAGAAALGFHQAVVRMTVRMAQQCGVKQIALTGGVFANRILLEGCEEVLAKRGFAVYVNRQVPPGDGGISLGQAYYGLLKG
ncbi:MAG: carbamoyltransferase HypF [Oscillospiraceae bacterium]|nr:carbamoyltransferase HypF [Oscillospiraceae bacterium]